MNSLHFKSFSKNFTKFIILLLLLTSIVSGMVRFTKIVQGSSATSPSNMLIDEDGNFSILGSTSSTNLDGVLRDPVSVRSLFYTKRNNVGDSIVTKYISSTNAIVNSMTKVSSNFYLIGYSDSLDGENGKDSNNTRQCAFISKRDLTAEKIENTFDCDYIYLFSGSTIINNRIYLMGQTEKLSITAGSTEYNNSFIPNDDVSDIFSKRDLNSLDYTFIKYYYRYTGLRSVAVDSQDNIILTGQAQDIEGISSNSSLNEGSVFYLKYNQVGQLQYVKYLNKIASGVSFSFIDSSDYVYLIGSTYDDVTDISSLFIAKINSNDGSQVF